MLKEIKILKSIINVNLEDFTTYAKYVRVNESNFERLKQKFGLGIADLYREVYNDALFSEVKYISKYVV